jgi:hypothetical protein
VTNGVGFAFGDLWREANLAFAERYPQIGFGRFLVPVFNCGIESFLERCLYLGSLALERVGGTTAIAQISEFADSSPETGGGFDENLRGSLRKGWHYDTPLSAAFILR